MGSIVSPFRIIKNMVVNFIMTNKSSNEINTLLNSVELRKGGCVKTAVVLTLKHYRNV